MSGDEINSKLEEFDIFFWEEIGGKDYISKENQQKITNKLVELGIFNINFTDNYFMNEISGPASLVLEDFTYIFKNGVTTEEKINQLLNNPNIINLVCRLGQPILPTSLTFDESGIDNLLEICIEARIPYEKPINSLLIIEQIFKNIENNNIILDSYRMELFRNIIESTAKINKEDEKAKDIIRKIIALAFPIKNNNTNLSEVDKLSWNTKGKLLTIVQDNDFIIENIMTILKNGHYNNDYFEYLMGSINNVDKRIELIKRLIDYSKEKNKPYFQSFMLSSLFEPTEYNSKANNDEDRFKNLFKSIIGRDHKNNNQEDYYINILKRILDDEKIKEYVDGYTIQSIFRNIDNQETLLKTYEIINNDPSLQKYFNSNAIITFLKKVKDDRQKIEYSIKNLNNNRINIEDISLLLRNEIRDKSLLLDKELMEPIYMNENFLSIASIALLASDNKITSNTSKIFSEDEKKYLDNGKLDELIEKYKTIGFIDDKTLSHIYSIARKFNPSLKNSDINNKISNNINAKEILEYISSKQGHQYYNYQLDKFLKLYPKTRFDQIPELCVFTYLSPELCEKFNLKTWEQLIHNPLFNKDTTTKSALIEIIAISGLFEQNDPDVESRKRKIIEIFGNKNLQLPISESDLKNYILFNITVNNNIPDIFEPATIKSYKLKEGVVIPEDLSIWLSKNLTESEMRRIKKTNGNIGSKLTKFIAPYIHTENGWILRNGINIDMYSNYLKNNMTDEEFKEVVESEKTPLEVLNFLSPYEQREIKAWKLKTIDSLNDNDQHNKYEIYKEELLDANLLGRYNSQSLHQIFDGLKLTYNKEFYEFFIENQEAILSTKINQTRLKDVQKDFDEIKKYFAKNGNQNPNYNDMINYLDRQTYPDVTFGNEEFAKTAKNAKVSLASYSYYQELIEITRKRYLTTVPRHNKIYEYIAPDGTKYEVMAKVLRADDPFNMLVGEVNYTNCCQRRGSMGEPCMRHAATSQNGGIFATYLMINGEPSMLTQSWFWTNESRACLDDIEATDLIKEQTNTKTKKLYEDIAMFAIEESCKEMLEESKKTVEAYIEKQRNEINNSNMSDEEKKQKTERLKIDSQRMRLHEITVGGSNNKISIDNRFKTKSEEESYGPKGYGDLYRDSYVQYVIADTGEEILTPDDNYEEKALYRDERQVEYEEAGNISYRTLKKITDIKSNGNGSLMRMLPIAHKEEMTAYTQNNQFVITEPSYLAELCNCSLNDLRVISGEDWYYVYSDRPDKIEIYDFAKKTPRIEDEGMEQFSEMVKGFEKIVSDSILTDENGKEIDRKPICADLREDTSYLLYLQEIRRGKIEQIGDDIVFPYNDITNTKTITQEEQNQILENKKEIRENQNPDMIMHRVSFKPTDKMVEKLLGKRNGENRNVGRSLQC